MEARQGRAERRLAQAEAAVAEAVEQVANQLNAVKSKVLHEAQTARTVGDPPFPSVVVVGSTSLQRPTTPLESPSDEWALPVSRGGAFSLAWSLCLYAL
jgi:hypothetical protein